MAKQRANSPERLALMEISREAKALRKKWTEEAEDQGKPLTLQSLSINEILLGFYREEAGQSDFRTILQMETSRVQVSKGEKYFPIWVRTKRIKAKDDVPRETEEGEVLSFFLCAVCFMLGRLS